MRLYFSPGACSLSPHIVLREAGMQFELERVDLRTKKTRDGKDFRTINPKGQVPVLELDDGQTLTEGPVIVRYIADRKPRAELMPAPGSLQRYRAQEWLNFITSELHKGFGPLFKPDTPDSYKPIVMNGLADRFTYLDRHLSGGPFLMDGQFSVADAYLFTVANWTHPLKIDMAPWPNLLAFMNRVATRPHVQEALKAEGLIK